LLQTLARNSIGKPHNWQHPQSLCKADLTSRPAQGVRKSKDAKYY
jgi:hypothetical protein